MVGHQKGCLESLTSDSSGKSKIFGHDCDSLSVNCTKVGVFEEADKVGFSGFLESKDSRALESELLLELVSNLSDESLEWELSDEEVGGLLVLSDFSKGDGTWSVSVRLLDTSSGWGALSRSLRCELLSWSFSTG